jgi:hypothetical protein
MCRVTASKLSMNILKIQSFYTKNITSELKNISVVLGVVAEAVISIYIYKKDKYVCLFVLYAFINH